MRITNKADWWRVVPALLSTLSDIWLSKPGSQHWSCSTTEVGCADLAPGATGAWHGSHINRAVSLGVLSV